MAEETVTTGTTTQANTAAASAANAAGSSANGDVKANAAEQQQTASDIEKLIKSAEDRVRNQMGNENKRLRAALEAEQKKNLSESEIKDLELKEREKTLADRDKALTEKENRWIAMQAIKEAGLDDGSKDSLELVNFVMADNEDGIKERVKTFKTLVDAIVKKQVEGVFKANGRTPGVGSDTASNAGGENESYAVRNGKNAAAVNQKSRSILDSYGLGGK